MAIFPANTGRQWPLTALLKITGADITNARIASGVPIPYALDLPPEYIVLDGFVYVETAFDGTTNTITLGDTGAATRYANAVSLKTAATTAFTGVPFHSSTIDDIMASVTWTGTPTAIGVAWVFVRYVIPGRANEAQTS